ncbi:MAG: hypothetical protein KME29_15530 [Calothrix sp. FI2-JRJ7]|jgi:energy-coupling factor transporter ATP-binding protein EcfA2|nr:hypothetical protein [Calothrix sp. FI2-JRJ7]
MLHNAFIQEIILLKSRAKTLLVASYIACVLSMFTTAITPRGINKINLSLLGFISSVVGLCFAQLEDRLNLKLEDLNIQARVTSKEIYAGLLKDNNFSITLPVAPINEVDVITDVVEYWKKQEKHLAIVGGTGDGKSFTIKHFISCIQSEYSIVTYDVDYARDDYPECVDIKYDYVDIEQAFVDDMEELENRIAVRRQLGKKYIPDKKLIVGEEMPALAEECESLGVWMRKMSKRGRKVGLFIAALAQNDTAENFSLKGDASILKSNFCLLYLGKKAIVRAKQLKNDALVDWLSTTSKGRGLIDDKPCIITANTYSPTSNIEANNVQVSSEVLPIVEDSTNSKIDRSSVESEVEVLEVPFSEVDFDAKKLEIARILRAENYSKNKIIKLLWDVEGGRKYSELSKLIDEK